MLRRSRTRLPGLVLALLGASAPAFAQDLVPTPPDAPAEPAPKPEPEPKPDEPVAAPEPKPEATPETTDEPAPVEPAAKEPAPSAAPAPAAAKTLPPPIRLETKDELPEAGYVPGYRPYMGLGTSPYAPRMGSSPGGITPGFAAPMPSDAWLFTWKGFMSASLQVSMDDREDPGPGQHKKVLHTGPSVIEEYAAFPSTNSVPGNWIGSNFSYGNSFVTATVSIDTWNPTRPTQNYGLGSQYFINNAFLSFRAQPFGHARLSANVGYFANNYGGLGRYGGGFYTNPMTGTIQGAGETIVFEYDVSDTLVATVEHGLMGTGGPRVGFIPRDVVTGTGNGGAGGDPQWPAAYLQHLHLGLVRKGDIQLNVQAHYVSNWFQDERVQRPANDPVCDLPPTNELDECYVRDGRIRVYGLDARLISNVYGVLGVGGSLIDASYAFPLKGFFTFAGDGELLTSAWLGARTGGTGKVWVGGAAYNLSIASLMLSPEPFSGQAPDIVINTGFNIGVIKSAAEPFADRVRYKYGADALYTFSRYAGVGFRFDQVVPASDDPDQTFEVIAPRLQFKTDWTSHETITLGYVKWFLGSHSHVDGLNPRDPARIDDQMFTLNFNMWW